MVAGAVGRGHMEGSSALESKGFHRRGPPSRTGNSEGGKRVCWDRDGRCPSWPRLARLATSVVFIKLGGEVSWFGGASSEPLAWSAVVSLLPGCLPSPESRMGGYMGLTVGYTFLTARPDQY